MKLFALFLGLFCALTTFVGEIEWALLPVSRADGTRWAVADEDAKRAMTGVHEYVAQQSAKQKVDFSKKQYGYILSHWDSYVCQVIGDVFLGKKTIVLNFMPRRVTEDREFDWKKDEWSVKGGGAEYFCVRYDVEHRVFQEVWINAPE